MPEAGHEIMRIIGDKLLSGQIVDFQIFQKNQDDIVDHLKQGAENIIQQISIQGIEPAKAPMD